MTVYISAFSATAFSVELASLLPRLRLYARSLARDRDVAEDLVQEALLKAWAARDRFQAGTNLRAWVFTILRNVFLSQRRRARFQGEYDELAAEQRLAVPEHQSAAVELSEVHRAVEQLPDVQRDALLLITLDGLTYEQAADRSGVSLAAFKSRVSRGRASIGALLQAAGPVKHAPEVRATAEADARSSDLRDAWAVAKAAGRPLMIG